MLVGVIQKKTLAEIKGLVQRLDVNLYDLLELRLDGCADLTPEGLAKIEFPLPVIFTLRAAREGGAFTGSEEERLNMLERLISLKPAYLDVEAFVAADDIARLRAASPETQIILSAHNFVETPADLDALLESMRKKAAGVIYKVAALAQSTPDALRLLLFCKKVTAAGVPIIGISMGEYGECTRILAPVYHLGFTYCPVEEATALGQLNAVTLRDIYNFKLLNPDTAVYGLLGDPVLQSQGHLYHNRKNREEGLNSVYVKWRISPEKLAESMELLTSLRVRGGSVTMPLKEKVLPLIHSLDESAAAMGAVNTLKLETGGYAGINTDGAGAVNIVPLALQGLNVVILGAGGAARAIMWEALKRGAKLSVYNRSAGKKLPGGLFTLPLEQLVALKEQPCDLIINTLPFDISFDFSQVPFKKTMLAYDISYGKKSRFLELAQAAGCSILDGQSMFEAQAVLQRAFWSESSL